MFEAINLEKPLKEKPKTKEWAELGKWFGAEQLVIYQAGERASLSKTTTSFFKANFAYHLIFKIFEDDIHLILDSEEGAGVGLYIDNPIFKTESIEKLKQAIACLERIQTNKEKYCSNTNGVILEQK